MTRVTNEDLAYVKEHLGLSAPEYAKVDAVIEELLALRKVADAAKRLLDLGLAAPAWIADELREAGL